MIFINTGHDQTEVYLRCFSFKDLKSSFICTFFLINSNTINKIQLKLNRHINTCLLCIGGQKGRKSNIIIINQLDNHPFRLEIKRKTRDINEVNSPSAIVLNMAEKNSSCCFTG